MAKAYTAQAADLKVDREKRKINGVAIIRKGDANGDIVDDESLRMFAALGSGGGIRARFDHPKRADPREIEQTLEKLMGEHTNFRVEGDAVRADCVLAGVNTDLEEKILTLAEKTPHLFGVSVVFDDTPLKKGERPPKNPPCRPLKLYAGDFVDIPAANAGGLFAAKTAKESLMADVFAKDGKFFCMVEGKEVELDHSKEAVAALQDDGDDAEADAAKKKSATRQTAAAEEKPVDAEAIKVAAIEEGRKSEREYRKMFSTVVKTAGLKGKAVEDFEQFYGLEEKQLKYLAQHTIGARAAAVGEGSGEEEQTTTVADEGKKIETDAAKRFSASRDLRQGFGVMTNDAENAGYKAGLKRYIAREKQWAEDQKPANANSTSVRA